MKEKLPLKDQNLDRIQALNPYFFDFESLEQLGLSFDTIIDPLEYDKFYSELVIWESEITELSKKFTIKMKLTDFYNIERIKKRFPLLTRLSLSILSLSTSSCEVERIFSKMKLIKTPLRNRLSGTTLESLLMLKTIDSKILAEEKIRTNLFEKKPKSQKSLACNKKIIEEISYDKNENLDQNIKSSPKRKLDQMINIEEVKGQSDHIDFMTQIRNDSPLRPEYISKMTTHEKKELLTELQLPKKRLKKIMILESDTNEEYIKLESDIREEKIKLESSNSEENIKLKGDIDGEKIIIEANNGKEFVVLEEKL
jgi:hypothetical protein